MGSRKKHPGIRHHLSAPKCTIVGDVRSRSVYLAGLTGRFVYQPPVFQSALPIRRLFVRLSGSLGSDLSYPLTFSPRDPLGTKRLRAAQATRRSDAPAVPASLPGEND